MSWPKRFLTRNGQAGPFHGDDVCMRCGKQLDHATSVWLELDQRTNEYHDYGGVPPEFSQGGFEFGRDCADALRKRALEAKKDGGLQ